MRILFYSTQAYDIESFDSANKDYAFELSYVEAHLNEQTALLANGYEAVCVFVNDSVNAEVLRILSEIGVKYLALRCAGFNNVDLFAAKKYNIKVVRVPEYSPYAVAEHSCALILTLNRKTHKAYNRTRDANFKINGLKGFDLAAKTIGIIGCGRIGQVAAKIFNGFGMKVVVYDPYYQDSLEFATKVSFEELLSCSDIVSLYCPLNKETKHLIDAQAIKQMKDGVMIINTSRGALVDTKAVIAGLKSGKIGYLGIDVYEEEAGVFFEDHTDMIMQDEVLARLLTFPNVLVTGHQAFFTTEALSQIAATTLANLDACFNQKELFNLVTIVE